MSSALLTAFTTVYLYLKNADTYIAFAKVCGETTLLILAIALAVRIENANRPEYRIHRNSGRCSPRRELLCRFTTKTCSSISRPTLPVRFTVFFLHWKQATTVLETLVKFLHNFARSLTKERSHHLSLKCYEMSILCSRCINVRVKLFEIIICGN